MLHILIAQFQSICTFLNHKLYNIHMTTFCCMIPLPNSNHTCCTFLNHKLYNIHMTTYLLHDALPYSNLCCTFLNHKLYNIHMTTFAALYHCHIPIMLRLSQSSIVQYSYDHLLLHIPLPHSNQYFVVHSFLNH